MKKSFKFNKKVKHLVLLVTAFLWGLNLFAQTQLSWEKTEEDIKESKKFKNNYFQSIGFTPFFNIFNYHYKYYNEYDHREVSDKITGFSLVSIQYDARYNFFNYHDFFSISFNASPMIGIIPLYDMGLHMQLPLGVDFNFFNHSTYNNVNDIGFSLGGGICLQRASNLDANLIDPVGWKDFYGRFVFKFRKYKIKSTVNISTGAKNKNYYSYIGLQYGRGKSKLVVNGIDEKEINTSFKIVFGKILAY